jgi:hypothetical protein
MAKLFKKIDKVLWDAKLKLENMLYTKKGSYRKGINKRQRKYLIRAKFIVVHCMLDRAEVYYEKFVNEQKQGLK